MKIYIVKITSQYVVDEIINLNEFVHDGIYNFEEQLQIGDPVIIYFGGDKAQISWDQGIRGLGRITATPYNKGYDPQKAKNFKIKIRPLDVLSKSIPPKTARTHKKLSFDIYDIPYIGANHFPTQAISSYEDPIGIKALAKLYNEYSDFDFREFFSDIEFFAPNHSLSIPAEFSRLASALLAKPFLILAGLSGSGKSKIATRFADWILSQSMAGVSCKAFVAVGSDWTDNRHVLGFANTLRSEEHEVEGESVIAPVYQSTEILKLILKAKDAPELPHFLILDEMNLSHVERYFSDFLAHLETPDEPMRLHHLEKCLIHIEENHQSVPENESENISDSVDADEDVGSTSPPQNAGKWRLLDQTIKLPPNLFVIGTVNVDETTYMFSPKVLDRANVIECRTTKDDLVKAADSLFAPPAPDGEPEKAPEGTAQAFLDLALKARDHKWLASDPNPKTECEDSLKKFVDALHHISELILKPAGLELTYRPQKEILAYARVDYYFHRNGGATADGVSGETTGGTETEEPGSAENESSDGEEESEVEDDGENATASTASVAWDWQQCLDEQIMQKILPKLTGNERKLGEVLEKLREYCEANLLPDADMKHLSKKMGRVPGDRNLSQPKILQMQERLKTDRFTGYF
jgi:hypothetical protein